MVSSHATYSRRAWSAIVLMPMALMTGYGITFGLASRPGRDRSPLFDTMTDVIPAACWGVSWFIVAISCAIGAVSASWQWLRFATVAGWALSSGMLFSVLWARYVNDAYISYVGISWIYAVWASCLFSAIHGPIQRQGERHGEKR